MADHCDAVQKELTDRAQSMRAELDAQMGQFRTEIESRARDLAPDVDTSGPDIWLGLDIDVKWKDTRIILELPEVTIKDQKIALDLPQFKMTDKVMIFHTPSIRMETKKTGEYPEFYCDTSTFIPKCTVRWSPIYMDVPVPFMQEQRIVVGIPEVWVATTEFVMGIPEFRMGRQEIVLTLPEFTVKNVNTEVNKAKERGEALKQEATARSTQIISAFQEHSKVELGGRVTDVFDCYRDQLAQAKNNALASFDGQITGIQATIANLVNAKVPNDNELLEKMRRQLDDTQGKRKEFIESLNQKLIELDNAQKMAVESLMGSFSNPDKKAA